MLGEGHSGNEELSRRKPVAPFRRGEEVYILS